MKRRNMIAPEALWMLPIMIVLLCSCFSECICQTQNKQGPRIAIIGGGIGGAVTAYELSRLATLNGSEIFLDLFEANEIGGRLATTVVNGNEFETGGSIIHVENKHMVDYVEKNGLHWYTEPPDCDFKSITGFYNGEEFVFKSSQYSFLNAIHLLWRYGLDLVTFNFDLVEPMLDHFKRIYEAQEKQIAFDDVHSLLTYMDKDFPELMKIELKKSLQSRGYKDRFIDEIVFLATNINYNQNTDIPAFVGSVSLAGAQEGSLKSVQGGNRRVPETLVANSDAVVFKARVDSVRLRPDSKFCLEVGNESRIYDFVVIACPIIENSKDKLTFKGFPDLKIPRIEYQKTVATIVHGELNHTYFGYESPEGLPNEILSVNDKLFYNSISHLSPVTFDRNYDNKVFKVFSKEVLTDEQLDLLFIKHDIVKVVPWLAYPLYDIKDRNLSFVLHKNLFYVNAIEWAASAMEMSAISGVNIALHIYKQINSSNVKRN